MVEYGRCRWWTTHKIAAVDVFARSHSARPANARRGLFPARPHSAQSFTNVTVVIRFIYTITLGVLYMGHSRYNRVA